MNYLDLPVVNKKLKKCTFCLVENSQPYNGRVSSNIHPLELLFLHVCKKSDVLELFIKFKIQVENLAERKIETA